GWRRGRGGVRCRGGLVGLRALSDAVLGGDLVIVRLPVGDARVGVGQDGPRIGEERFPIVGRATIDLVVRDWGTSIGRWRRPREDDGGIARRRGETLRSARRSGGGGRGCRGFVGWGAVSERFCGCDGVAVGWADVVS